jgi:putative membrane protein
MRYWLLNWILKAVSLLIVARILPGIQVDGFVPALIAAAVIGLASAILGLFLKIILFPFIILTLGLVYFLINGFMLQVASAFVPGFRVNGLLTATIASILLTLVDFLLNRIAGF